MRYLLYTALALSACGRTETARDTRTVDTAVSPNPTPPAPAQTMSAVPDRLLGSWTGQGYDQGSTRSQQFTLTWSRAPDGGLVGTMSFKPGESYGVKVILTNDSIITYESEPHRSPTLKGQVVTRTEARLVGDSLIGSYTARATQGGKVLRGRFTATRGSAPAQ